MSMTNFLRTDSLRERFKDIAEAAEYLEYLLGLSGPERKKLLYRYRKRGFKTTVKDEMARTARSIAAKAKASAEFMDQLPSQPVIYTGPGDTEAVIRMLEALVTSAQVKPPATERPGRNTAGRSGRTQRRAGSGGKEG
ncbi:MAG: hypothetical protein ACYC9Q_01230 [Bacillota bacterium]